MGSFSFKIRPFVQRHRGPFLVLAGLLALTGVDLILFPPKGQILELLALPFVATGLALVALVVRTPKETKTADPTLAARLIHRLTLGGRLIPWLPVVGIALILADIGYNAYVAASAQFGTEDTFTLLLGAALVLYPYIPIAHRRERDFVLVALSFLEAILVLPLLIARAVSSNWEYSVDLYSWIALAYQLAGALSLVGVAATVHAVPGSTAPGLTVLTNAGTQVTVVITTACSGLYSFGLFASAFFAYVLTEFRRLTWRVWAFLALGTVASYLANLLRMIVVVLAGVYGSTPEQSVQNLLVAHSYAGWLIFLGWIGLFWILLVRFLRPVDSRVRGSALVPKEARNATPSPRRRGVFCGLCDESLSPARPGYRCECTVFYHAACAATASECPRCQRPMPTSTVADAAKA